MLETSPERVWAELRRLVLADRVLDGSALADRLGVTAAVLPELTALRGVEQSHFHHLDVHGHTLEVLRAASASSTTSRRVRLDTRAPARRARRAAGDELTRTQALRFAALFHDMASRRRAVSAGRRVTFIGHDAVGEGRVIGLCRRLRTSETARAFLGRVTRDHLVLGFLVHERPLDGARSTATCARATRSRSR